MFHNKTQYPQAYALLHIQFVILNAFKIVNCLPEQTCCCHFYSIYTSAQHLKPIPIQKHNARPPENLSVGARLHRSAAEELVRSQFSAFKNMPTQGIQLERRSQPRLGGSTASLNKLADPMSTSLTLSCRNASSISDLTSTDSKQSLESPPVQVHVPLPTAKAAPVEAETPSRGSKFAPANIFKSFFK